ncbi:MAG: helix-hairpin-helix domain-containing protein [Bacteroidales bacterium]|nr:helix-hairpin-helix domain-containing protein [Bacteroidales bacterium]MCF8334412.1 helix-hairpin-helix domain-containing protein [Bacteroidales bacterium]
MNKKPRKFFEFNTKERIGVLTLLAILLLLIVIYLLLPRFISLNGNTSNKEFKKQVEAFIEARKKEKDKKKQKTTKKDTLKNKVRKPEQLTPFPFDPNNLPENKWKEIGFSQNQIQIIKNYEKSGGSFDKKEDLKKIYGITQQEFAQLEPYINIKKPEKKKASGKQNKINEDSTTPRTTLHIDLNSTDSSELIKIRGIGEVFSQRIIKYRDYLGGFYTKKQLLEVYNFDSSNYLPLKNHFWTDTTNIQKVNINTATFKELQRHPYMDYYLVKQIVNYREDHGRFKSLSELNMLDLMYDELYEKLKHYLVL